MPRKRTTVPALPLLILYIAAGIAFASATGFGDGSAVHYSGLGWIQDLTSWFPRPQWGNLTLSTLSFMVGIVLYHLYTGCMVQAGIKSTLMQGFLWITLMTIVVAWRDGTIQNWTTLEKGLAGVILILILVLMVSTSRHG